MSWGHTDLYYKMALSVPSTGPSNNKRSTHASMRRPTQSIRLLKQRYPSLGDGAVGQALGEQTALGKAEAQAHARQRR